jgi:hypothetical protein
VHAAGAISVAVEEAHSAHPHSNLAPVETAPEPAVRAVESVGRVVDAAAHLVVIRRAPVRLAGEAVAAALVIG